MLQVCPVKGLPQGNFSFPLGGVRLITSHHLPAGFHPYHVGRIQVTHFKPDSICPESFLAFTLLQILQNKLKILLKPTLSMEMIEKNI